MSIIILIIIYVSVISNAYMDRIMPELYVRFKHRWFLGWTKKQWQWHLAKWLCVFSIWGYMSYHWFDVTEWELKRQIFTFFIGFCSLSWGMVYKWNKIKKSLLSWVYWVK